MSFLVNLLSGAAVTTPVNGQTQLDNVILIGDVDTANPLQQLTVVVDNDTTIDLRTASLIQAFGKWMNQVTGSVLTNAIKIATGRIKKQTNYTFVNSGVTTPAIYAWSDQEGGVPVYAATVSININSNSTYEKFSCLLIQTPANVTSAEIEFMNGARSTFSNPVELASLYAMKYPSETDGYVAGVLIVDNRDRSIKSIKVYAGATAVTLAVVAFDNDDFKMLTKGK